MKGFFLESFCKVGKRKRSDIPSEVSSSSSITFRDEEARVVFDTSQVVAFDGCAMVKLLEGSVSMLGYSLIPGEMTLVSSNAKLCSALTFETKISEVCILKFVSYRLGNHTAANNDDRTPSFELEILPRGIDGQIMRCKEITSESEETTDGATALKKRKRTAAVNLRKDMVPTTIPATWWTSSDHILKSELPPIVVVSGLKGSGKSTYGRFLVNRLLSRFQTVGYLDTDLGQPEFTLPGCLSLHILNKPVIGSPVIHLRTPERCLFYGDTSPKGDPHMYMQYIMDLYDHFRKTYEEDEGMPLVINTHGWLKGIGLDVFVDLLRYIVPTHLIQIKSDSLEEDLPATHPTLLLIVQSESQRVNSSELRNLRILSYFESFSEEQCFQYPWNFNQLYAETAKGLAYHVPYQVSVEDINVVHLHCEVAESEKIKSLNGRLVGFASDNDKKACIGFGIIRSVDISNGMMYVVTPCPLESMDDVNTILHGRLDIPVKLLQVKGLSSPYLCSNSVVIEGSASLHRRRIRARKKIKVDEEICV